MVEDIWVIFIATELFTLLIGILKSESTCYWEFGNILLQIQGGDKYVVRLQYMYFNYS